MSDKQQAPYVVVAPWGVAWVGHAVDEETAWIYALGWPHEDELAEKKLAGWYCAPATVTWTMPEK